MWKKCVFILSLFVALSHCAAYASTKSTGWLLIQHNHDFGDIRLLVTDHAIKWDLKSAGLALIANEPDWHLTGYNFTSRTFYPFTNEELQRMLLGSDALYHRGAPPAGLKGNITGMVRGATTPIAGHECVQYIYPQRIVRQYKGVEAENPHDSIQDKSVYGPLDGPRREIWYAADVVFPPAISKGLSRGATTELYIPMREHRYRQRGTEVKKLIDIDTTVAKRTKVEQSEFIAPKGFAKAPSQMAFLMNGAAADDLLVPMKIDAGK
ncbi:MAG TPA: hypothetical protein V6C81_28050 [Planktothrix sp.]